MRDGIADYLSKRADLLTRPLVCDDTGGIAQAVVIPALGEYPQLLDTLNDLSMGPPEVLSQTLVVVVVNNRALPHARAEDVANNLETISALTDWQKRRGPLRIGYIDAASPCRTLPEKDGVGLARKLGLDAGLAVLHDNGIPDGPLISLDADTRVGPGYLPAMRDFFARPGRWAAVIDYAHPLEDPVFSGAILRYELFLRYHELGLTYAGSPYAFHTIGSTIVCTGRAYAAVSGMNRRQAAEDFYFLQQLSKTGPLDRIHTTCVYPGARSSHRVPFGTGASLSKLSEQANAPYPAYDPQSYVLLRAWLAAAHDHLDMPERLLEEAAVISPTLASFLAGQDFVTAWGRILSNCSDRVRLWKMFHGWFDAFRTLKLMHYLRDHGYSSVDLFSAFPALMALLPPEGISGRFPAEDGPRAWLDWARIRCGALPAGGLASLGNRKTG